MTSVTLTGSYYIVLYCTPPFPVEPTRTVFLGVLFLTLIGILEKQDRLSALWNASYQYGGEEVTKGTDQSVTGKLSPVATVNCCCPKWCVCVDLCKFFEDERCPVYVFL